MKRFATFFGGGERVTTNEEGVFIQIQNSIVTSKVLVLVNCLNILSMIVSSLARRRFQETRISPLPRKFNPVSVNCDDRETSLASSHLMSTQL